MPHVHPEIAERMVRETYIPTMHDCGQLNHHITKVCKRYLEHHGEKYQTYNDIIGVLTATQLEMYRLKTAVYEDKKIRSNGNAWE